MLAPEELLAITLPVLEGGFGFTPWETQPAGPVQTPNNPGLDESDRAHEERKLRRMISNRESARRSRMRKRRHLEDLRCQVNRLRSENRDLSNRLGAVSYYCVVFRHDNDQLRSESVDLCRRLSEIRRFLLFRQPQRLSSPATAAVCGGGFISGNEQNNASLIV